MRVIEDHSQTRRLLATILLILAIVAGLYFVFLYVLGTHVIDAWLEPPSPGLTTPVSPPCTQNLVVDVRGSGELEGLGSTTNTVAETLAVLNGTNPGSTAQVSLNYPASSALTVIFSLTTAGYDKSESTGVAHLTQFLNDQTARCQASQSFLVVGYSQGANVVGDVLSPGSRLSSATKANIRRVVLYGDPVFNPALQVASNEYKPSRLFPSDAGILGPRTRDFDTAYHGKILDICAAGDPVCSDWVASAIVGKSFNSSSVYDELELIAASYHHFLYAWPPYETTGVTWLTNE